MIQYIKGEVAMFIYLAAGAAIIWIEIYTFSFAVWTWKNKNKFGGFMVMCIALIAAVLPLLNLFIESITVETFAFR